MHRYPNYLKQLAMVYSRSYRTMTRWYSANKMVIYGAVPYSFSWIVWEVEHNHKSVEESIAAAPYKMDGILA